MSIPSESIECLALVKPKSDLARDWKFSMPTYGIYEYDKAFGIRQIRWGDGSSQDLTPEQHDDLILLPQFGDEEISELFD